MFDRSFLTSKLGLAALASVAAMAIFNIMTLTHQFELASHATLVAAPLVELA